MSHRTEVEEVIGYWRDPRELASFALARTGYGQTDVGYGVTYPADLDPGDKPLPSGCVEIYGGFGAAFEVAIPETTYLDILADVLRRNGHNADADNVANLSARLTKGEKSASE